MTVLVGTEDGVYTIDLETEAVLGFEAGSRLPDRPPVAVELPRVIDAARSGSTVVAVVDRRPPLVVSHDAGSSWRESGGGLPAGRAVAIAETDPDLVVYAARNRLYASSDGGRFWRALAPELPAIDGIALTAA